MTTTRKLTIPGDEWDLVRRRVAPFASTDEARPVLTMVRLSVRKGERRWEATDSYMAARLGGGETKAADGAVLIPAELFRPARPKPVDVQLTWTKSRLTVTKNTAVDSTTDIVEGDPHLPHPAPVDPARSWKGYPDLAKVFKAERPGPRAVEFEFDGKIESDDRWGAVPLMIAGDGVWCPNGNGWVACGKPTSEWRITPPRYLSLKDTFVNRLLRCLDAPRFKLSDPMGALYVTDGLWEGLLMPMRSNPDLFLGEGWDAEVVPS